MSLLLLFHPPRTGVFVGPPELTPAVCGTLTLSLVACGVLGLITHDLLCSESTICGEHTFVTDVEPGQDLTPVSPDSQTLSPVTPDTLDLIPV